MRGWAAHGCHFTMIAVTLPTHGALLERVAGAATRCLWGPARFLRLFRNALRGAG